MAGYPALVLDRTRIPDTRYLAKYRLFEKKSIWPDTGYITKYQMYKIKISDRIPDIWPDAGYLAKYHIFGENLRPSQIRVICPNIRHLKNKYQTGYTGYPAIDRPVDQISAWPDIR